MTNLAKSVLAALVLAVAFFGTLLVNAVRHYGVDAVALPVAHAFGLGIFPWPEWAQWLVLASLCVWPATTTTLLFLVAYWPEEA